MNAYIIVEGRKTEYIVYPKWLEILAPALTRVDNVIDITENSYYIFCGGGIPSIYRHIANAVADINAFNSRSEHHIDCLMVCIDTEEESREYIMSQINRQLKENNVAPESFDIVVFEQRVSMESWFLGNRKIVGSNPSGEVLRRYLAHYNVRTDDPELMEIINDNEDFQTKAQFHHSYLKEVFKEHRIKYSKSNPGEVCKPYYLNQIIERYKDTGHIPTFGRWYDFVITLQP